MTPERPPALAGNFYPDDSFELERQVTALLDSPPPEAPPQIDPDRIRAVVVPHGDMLRAGAIQAMAYRILKNRRKPPGRLLLLGPLHTGSSYGIVLPTSPSFRIPTGSFPVDRAAIRQLAGFAETLFSDESHEFEHSIETQLPFLMTLWGGLPIVPVGYSDITARVLFRVLETLMTDPETLTICSADFSHYFSAEKAARIDQSTIDRILAGGEVDRLESCGAIGINTLNHLAHQFGTLPSLLTLSHSGVATGETSQVIGYAAITYTQPRR
ncbi:MAG: AmmeMemoRadiSam system protein B [Leptospirillia bacterium]